MHPNWATISSPSPCGVGCAQVKWNNLSVANGVKALDAYDASHPGANVYYGFSESSAVMINSLMGKPNDLSDHYYLLGTPKSSAAKGYSLPAGDYSNVDFVAVQGDSVVFGNGNGNTLARHLSGYDKLDLSHPTSVTIDPRTQARTLYFAAPPKRRASATTQASAVDPAGEDKDTTAAVSRREAPTRQLAERREAKEQLRQERKQEQAARIADRKAERQARRAERAERSAA